MNSEASKSIQRADNAIDSSPASPETIMPQIISTENSNGGSIQQTQSMSNSNSNHSSNSQTPPKVPAPNFMKQQRQNGHNSDSSLDLLKVNDKMLKVLW